MYQDLLRRLNRVSAPPRDDLFVDAPQVDYGLFRMRTSREDRVVDGIVRKAGLQLAHTCSECGRQGRLRSVKFARYVLCALCYAPEALLAEVEQALRVLERAKKSRVPAAFSEGDWSARLVEIIPPDRWSKMRLLNDRGYVRFMPLDTALQIVPWLQAVHGHIKAMTSGTSCG